MPRYSGNDRTPRSKSRRSMLRRRGELDRTKKDRAYYHEMFKGYAHGINGPSGDNRNNVRIRNYDEGNQR
jgi:hypothetical protein